jgi:hypothetical protein
MGEGAWAKGHGRRVRSSQTSGQQSLTGFIGRQRDVVAGTCPLSADGCELTDTYLDRSFASMLNTSQAPRLSDQIGAMAFADLRNTGEGLAILPNVFGSLTNADIGRLHTPNN